jgi:hypothetical protein
MLTVLIISQTISLVAIILLVVDRFLLKAEKKEVWGNQNHKIKDTSYEELLELIKKSDKFGFKQFVVLTPSDEQIKKFLEDNFIVEHIKTKYGPAIKVSWD